MNEVELFSRVSQLLKDGTPFVLMTLTGIKGSAPQDLGSKALVGDEGLLFGTVGGGILEAAALQHAKTMLMDSTQEIKQSRTWNLQQELGMTCGGEATIFFEAYSTQPWNIALFGAGHVIQAMARILATMDCRVHCVDPRQDWLDRLPKASNIQAHCLSEPSASVAVIPKDSFVCVITQGHSTDLPILREVLRQDHNYPYVGMIGSSVKSIRMRKALNNEGFSKVDVESLHSPIGLPIGGNHPTEIAISIIAQLLEVRDAW